MAFDLEKAQLTRPALAILGVLAGLGTSCPHEAPPAAGGAIGGTHAPNVVLISVSALRADHLGCYGYPRATSPRIDELAARGIRFSQAFGQGEWTFSALPAMATSRFPQDYGDYWVEIKVGEGFAAARLPPDAPTIGEVLARSGYETALIAGPSWFRLFLGLERGFGTFLYDFADAEKVTSRALEWLRQRGQRPFFLWIHYMDPHVPYTPPAPFDTRFDDGRLATGRRPRLLAPDTYTGKGGIPGVAAIDGHRELDFYVARYDGEIAFVDSQVGRLLDGLRELRLDGDTIVVLTADHGEALGEHGLYFSHLGLHTEVVHVPLIVALPDRTPPRVVDSPVMAVDLLPTLAELVGSPVRDPRWAGRSLVDCARGLGCPHPEAFSTRGVDLALRTVGWTLMCPASLEACRLYDTDADPGETYDVALRHVDVFTCLHEHLTEWVRAHPDPRPRGEEGYLSAGPDMKAALRELGYFR